VRGASPALPGSAVAGARPRSVVSWPSWLVALPIGLAVGAACLAAGTAGVHGVYWRGDAPSFLAVARNPLGSGHGFPGDPMAQGVAYRYGRVLLPFLGWVLALGRASRVPVALAAVYVVTFACWIAVAAEQLRRAGRRPVLAWWILALPFVPLFVFFTPTVVAEPLAGALVLLAYLFDRDGRGGWSRVAAALAILARETMAVAFLPLAWRAWRDEGRKGLVRWIATGAPYGLWACWVRVRVGHFPFLDPASNRRDAFAPPFVGWWQTLHRPLGNGQQYGLLVGLLTIAVAVWVVRRSYTNRSHTNRSATNRPLAWAALTSSALVTCYGWSVWQFPSEAMRVLAPVHVLLLVAALQSFPSHRGRRAHGPVGIDLTLEPDIDEPAVSYGPDPRGSSRTSSASRAGAPAPRARARSARP
jgi:hypothetical protein